MKQTHPMKQTRQSFKVDFRTLRLVMYVFENQAKLTTKNMNRNEAMLQKLAIRTAIPNSS